MAHGGNSTRDEPPLNAGIRHHPARKLRAGKFTAAEERLAVEEPLEIRLGGKRFTLTMRTPGNDEDLVAGFLLAEGFIESRGDIGEIRRVRTSSGAPEPNILDVILSVPATNLRERLRRNFAISSSCGVCGKTSIDAIRRRIAVIDSPLRVAASAILELAPVMRGAQEVFAATGGLHAAGLFMASEKPVRADGARVDGQAGAPLSKVRLEALREDVGRHNAMDKLIGFALTKEMLPLDNAIIAVSGRLSFEIVQKAAVARVPVLAAVSAPSSLAVELAEEAGITLAGFVRGAGFNLYCHPERVTDRPN
jgi:FdhD protein